MARVVPAEHDLRRVIDEDREVDGLGPDELLGIYRSLVLLRTYDERSVVYHRQGRIGTYAIFWNHEAMQAGAVHALEDEIKKWALELMREGIAAAEAEPPVDPALLFENTFVDPPASFASDLEELRRI